jgi:hypothetical protein
MRTATVCLLVALAGCSDSTGPRTVEATLTVDWPLAREPGFVDAEFSVSPFDISSQSTIIASGPIPASGTAVTRFLVECGGRQVYMVGARGHFEQKGEGEAAICPMQDFFSFPDCDNAEYTAELFPYSDDIWGCQPPVD